MWVQTTKIDINGTEFILLSKVKGFHTSIDQKLMKLCVCEKDTMNLDFIFCDRQEIKFGTLVQNQNTHIFSHSASITCARLHYYELVSMSKSQQETHIGWKKMTLNII